MGARRMGKLSSGAARASQLPTTWDVQLPGNWANALAPFRFVGKCGSAPRLRRAVRRVGDPSTPLAALAPLRMT